METVKKIVIPTDFSVKSLNLVVDVIKKYPSSLLDIVLVHGYETSNSISDLLFFSKGKVLEKLQTSEFKKSCKLIQNTYQSRINSFKIDLITGDCRRYFNNYIEINAVDEVVLPVGNKMKLKGSQSFHLNHLISHSKCSVLSLDYAHKLVLELENTEQLANLFLSKAE